MKRLASMCGTASLAAVAVIALAANTDMRFRVARPVEVRTPAMSDSVDNKGNRFDVGSLLDTRLNTDFNRIPAEVVTAADGRFNADSPKEGMALQAMKTNIRAERFATGKLSITSPARFTAAIDGKEVMRKTTAEDSISDASTKTAPITLEPEHDYTLTVTLLADADAGIEPTVKFEFIPDDDFKQVAVGIDSEMKRRFSVDNCVEGTRIRRATLSADGKYVLCRYSQYYNPKKSRTYSRIFDTATGKVVTEAIPADVEWMPGSDNTLYYTIDTDGKWDLYTMTVPDLKRSLLMEGIESPSFEMSPDRSFIVYYRESSVDPEAGPLRRQRSLDDRIPGNRDNYYLVKQDVAGGNTQNLTYGTAKTNLVAISPDSKKILYISAVETPSQWPFYANSLVEMDLRTLKTDTIVKNEGVLNGACYSPDGKKLFVLGGPNMLGGIAKNCGDHPIANDFDVQGVIYDFATRRFTPVTRDFDPSIDDTPVWNRADGKIYFLATEAFGKHIYCLDPKSGKIDRIQTDCDYVRSFSIGERESRLMAYAGTDVDRDGEAFLINLKSGKNTVIDNPLQQTIGDIQFGKTQTWRFTASDGTVIDGDINLPPDFDPNKKYPLIVYYYGGTTPSVHTMHSPYSPAVLASRDYVVYVINPSGTIGYGQEFSARHVNAWGRRTAEDIIEGVKEFCKAHPFVDDKKIGCMGASYGGFMTQYLQTLTDIFACAVSHAGISNVTSYWGEGYWGYSYNSVAAAQSYPWTDPKLFTEQGSLFNADKIHTPLLLLHGTVDTNVPIGESIQLFNALRILGRDVEFITVDDQNHIITDVDKRRLWQNTIMAWFDKYLKDDPAWWNSLYGK